MKYEVAIPLIVVLFLLSGALVSAHRQSQGADADTFYEYMDEMHELVIQGLSPEAKEQANIMHEGCMNYFESEESNLTEEKNMIGGMMAWW